MPSQTDRLYNLLKDGEPHNTLEIMDVVYGNDHLGLARVGARIFDTKRKYGVCIHSWPDRNKRSITWYQIIEPESKKTEAKKIVAKQNILSLSFLSTGHDV